MGTLGKTGAAVKLELPVGTLHIIDRVCTFEFNECGSSVFATTLSISYGAKKLHEKRPRHFLSQCNDEALERKEEVPRFKEEVPHFKASDVHAIYKSKKKRRAGWLLYASAARCPPDRKGAEVNCPDSSKALSVLQDSSDHSETFHVPVYIHRFITTLVSKTGTPRDTIRKVIDRYQKGLQRAEETSACTTNLVKLGENYKSSIRQDNERQVCNRASLDFLLRSVGKAFRHGIGDKLAELDEILLIQPLMPGSAPLEIADFQARQLDHAKRTQGYIVKDWYPALIHFINDTTSRNGSDPVVDLKKSQTLLLMIRSRLRALVVRSVNAFLQFFKKAEGVIILRLGKTPSFTPALDALERSAFEIFECVVASFEKGIESPGLGMYLCMHKIRCQEHSPFLCYLHTPASRPLL